MRAPLPPGFCECRVVRESPNNITVTYHPEFSSEKQEHTAVYTEDTLPELVFLRMVVLEMIPVDCPIPYIEGIGRRIDQDTFWIEVDNGNYTRRASEGTSSTAPEKVGRLLFLSGYWGPWVIWSSRYNRLRKRLLRCDRMQSWKE